jgi:hypothetical protein
MVIYSLVKVIGHNGHSFIPTGKTVIVFALWGITFNGGRAQVSIPYLDRI